MIRRVLLLGLLGAAGRYRQRCRRVSQRSGAQGRHRPRTGRGRPRILPAGTRGRPGVRLDLVASRSVAARVRSNIRVDVHAAISRCARGCPAATARADRRRWSGRGAAGRHERIPGPRGHHSDEGKKRPAADNRHRANLRPGARRLAGAGRPGAEPDLPTERSLRRGHLALSSPRAACPRRCSERRIRRSGTGGVACRRRHDSRRRPPGDTALERPGSVHPLPDDGPVGRVVDCARQRCRRRTRHPLAGPAAAPDGATARSPSRRARFSWSCWLCSTRRRRSSMRCFTRIACNGCSRAATTSRSRCPMAFDSRMPSRSTSSPRRGRSLTHDYVALLKIVVSVSRALAGLLLYPMTARAWNDRNRGGGRCRAVSPRATAIHRDRQREHDLRVRPVDGRASRSRHSPRIPSAVARGCRRRGSLSRRLSRSSRMSASFRCCWRSCWSRPRIYRLFGGAELRSAATRIALAGVLAALSSVVVYYGHFPESYSTLQRVRAQSRAAPAPSTVTTPAGAAPVEAAPSAKPGAVAAKPRHERLLKAAQLAVTSFGWPIALMAAVGAIALWAGRTRDQVTLLAAACGLVYVGFVGVSAMAPIEPRFQRYSEEFISRVNFAVMPVAVVLAARGVVWAWRVNLAARAASIGVSGCGLDRGRPGSGWSGFVRSLGSG